MIDYVVFHFLGETN